MSRVEPNEQPQPAERSVADRRRDVEKAEGDEKTIDEALKRQEHTRPED